MRQVRCNTEGCDLAGIVRDVPDQVVARGVVSRPPLFCAACGAAIPETVNGAPVPEKAVRRPPERRTRR